MQLVWQYMCVALTVKYNYFIGYLLEGLQLHVSALLLCNHQIVSRPRVGYITCYLLVMGVLERSP